MTLARWYASGALIFPLLFPRCLRYLYAGGALGPEAVVLAELLDSAFVPYCVFAGIGLVVVWREAPSSYARYALAAPIAFALFEVLCLFVGGDLSIIAHFPEPILGAIWFGIIASVGYVYVGIFLLGSRVARCRIVRAFGGTATLP